ncbi:hypothetical protein CB1_001171001 [Camelus ferus]|nr:hypothetical protein CB1_001171001 [Camelus ferus]
MSWALWLQVRCVHPALGSPRTPRIHEDAHSTSVKCEYLGVGSVVMLADDMHCDNQHGGGKPAKRLLLFSFQNNVYSENKAHDLAVEITNYVKASQRSHSSIPDILLISTSTNHI